MSNTKETVAINFKGTGMKAYINKEDFDPAQHKLWTETDARKDAAPLPAPQAEAAPAVPWAVPASSSAAPAKGAKTRKA